ncbi:hypothetical protein ACJX0J_034331, partial [Zea mays]
LGYFLYLTTMVLAVWNKNLQHVLYFRVVFVPLPVCQSGMNMRLRARLYGPHACWTSIGTIWGSTSLSWLIMIEIFEYNNCKRHSYSILAATGGGGGGGGYPS